MKRILRANKGTGLRDHCLFVLGINSGLRVSDLLALRVTDVIDERERIGNQERGVREHKTGKIKDFPLGETFRKAIKEYVADRFGDVPYQPSEPLFLSKKGARCDARHLDHRADRHAHHEEKDVWAHGVPVGCGRDADSEAAEPLDAEYHFGVYWDHAAGVGQRAFDVGVVEVLAPERGCREEGVTCIICGIPIWAIGSAVCDVTMCFPTPREKPMLLKTMRLTVCAGEERNGRCRMPESNLTFIEAVHAKFYGRCQICGQRMDQGVARYLRVNPDQPRTLDNALLVCPDCYEGRQNPALDGFSADAAVIAKVAAVTGWDESTVAKWLSEFAKRCTLIAMNSQGFRRYWSWGRQEPFRIVEVQNGRIVQVKRGCAREAE